MGKYENPERCDHCRKLEPWSGGRPRLYGINAGGHRLESSKRVCIDCLEKYSGFYWREWLNKLDMLEQRNGQISAFEAAASWWWVGLYYLRTLPKGRTMYCEAYTKGDDGHVALYPVETGKRTRYIHPDKLIELVLIPIDEP